MIEGQIKKLQLVVPKTHTPRAENDQKSPGRIGLSFLLKRLIEFISLLLLGKLFQQFLLFSPHNFVFILIGWRNFVSGIIIMNFFVWAEYFICCHWEQVWGMNEFMHNATNGKII